MGEHTGRGHGGSGRRPARASTHRMDQIRTTEHKRNLDHVKDVKEVTAMEVINDDGPEPHVSLSTIMAVFVSSFGHILHLPRSNGLSLYDSLWAFHTSLRSLPVCFYLLAFCNRLASN